MKRESKNLKASRHYHTPKILRVLRGPKEATPDKKYPGEYATRTVVMRTRKDATLREARIDADNTFSYECMCCHDCCGHWQTRVYYHRVFRIKRGEFAVVLHYVRNV